jgi:itaconate CoA-transferase
VTDLPLTGVTVVSLEQAVAAPFATRQLADLGARVIKVERTDRGDFARYYDESVLGQSSYFVWLNRSKESIALDIKSPAGAEALRRLVATADVLVHNLGPGAMARLGLDAASLAEAQPSLIHCTISGYGTSGVWAHRKAYDLLVQAEAGLVSLTGDAEQVARTGISIADIAAGMYAYSGILSALLQRNRTGRGVTVEVSLFEALAEWMGSPSYYAKYSGASPERVGAQHATIAPYGPFQTGDGETVMLAVQNQGEWVALCEDVLAAPEVATDPRFGTNSKRCANRAALNSLIGSRFAQLTREEAIALLDAARIANGHMNSIAEFNEHPVLKSRRRWLSVKTEAGVVGALRPPADLLGVPVRMDPVPGHGEHTRSILAELGYSDSAITELQRGGALLPE